MVKAISGNLTRPVRSWDYETDHPIEAVEADNYFLGVFDRLEPLDRITVTARRKGLVSIGTYVVLVSSTERVEVARMGAVWNQQREVASKPLKAPAETVRYVAGEAKINWRGPSRKWVVLVEGEVVAQGLDKAGAEAVASGEAPIPPASD